MTEPEWLGATDPAPMLEFLRGRASERKLRLFAVACCRSVAEVNIPHAGVRDAIGTAEQLAEGAATEADRLSAYLDVATSGGTGGRWGEAVARAVLRAEALAAAREGAAAAAEMVPVREAAYSGARARERAAQSHLCRCVFGNPFRPVTAHPSWLTSTVLSLAQGIYQVRAFDRLPILADALQDAGCEDAAVLEHCRGKGPHSRGCWVVDLVLGKT